MVSITVTLDDELKAKVRRLSWVNWSEVAREEANKKRIFEEFIRTGTLSKDDQEFCNEINWDPIDELELKEDYVKKLKESVKKPAGKPMTVEEFNKWCSSL